MFQLVYGIHRIMGAETEYGVISPDAPDTNPTILSAIVVNTYEKLEAKRTESLRRTIENNAQEARAGLQNLSLRSLMPLDTPSKNKRHTPHNSHTPVENSQAKT